MARLRNRSGTWTAGKAVWEGSTPLGDVSSSYSYTETCSDIVGFRDQVNPFSLERITNVLWFADGHSGTPGNRWRYQGFATPLNISAHASPITPEPSDAASLDMAAARSNINRPITDLPVFVFELKDIPRLIKGAGDALRFGKRLLYDEKKALHHLPFRAADAYLGYEFGLNPIIRDVMNMVGFSQSVSKKLNYLNKLYAHGGAGTIANTTVWDDQVVSSTGSNYLTGLYTESNYFATRKLTSRKKWVSLKWKPTGPPPQTEYDKLNLAVRLAYGLDISFATLWEAMPWSWLIDWYSGVGDILTNTRNTIPVNASNSCVMLKTHTRWEATSRISGFGGQPRPGPAGRLNLSRKVGGTLGNSLIRALPFLDGRQLSILTAIGVSHR